MLHYFEQQFQSAHILTVDGVPDLVNDGVSFGCGTEEELTEFCNQKIGQKILFYLLWSDDKLKYKPFLVFENDIHVKLNNKKFIDLSAATPRFK